MKAVRLLLALALVVLAVVTARGEASRAPLNTRNVLVVTTDGLRWEEVFGGADQALVNREAGGVQDLNALNREFWRDTPEARRQALLPFVWDVIAREGQLYGNQRRGSAAKVLNGLNFSYPGYNELFTGAPDRRINSNNKVPNPNVNVLEWLNGKPQFRGRIAAFCSWDVFPFILNEQRSGVPVNAGWEPLTEGKISRRIDLLNGLIRDGSPRNEESRADALTFALALEYLRARQPRVLYVSFDWTDNYAHEGRYDHYLRMAHQVDGYLNTLWETVQSLPRYRGRTTMIVSTDHGRGGPPTGWRNHGASVTGAENIWIAVLGPDTPALGERTQTETVTQGQIAATVAALLGEDYRAAFPHAAPPIAGAFGTAADGRR